MSTMAEAVALALPADARPLLRGVLHSVALAFAIAGTVLLMLVADKPAGYVGGAVFATSLMLLYGTSATYHQIHWGDTPRRIIKRFDHSMIFVLIAGTYTPFCLDVRMAWGIPMLAVVWTLAGLGALSKILKPDAPRWLGVALYVGLGWIALVAAAQVIDRYLGSPLALLLVGGALYTVGGLIYAIRRPDPWPRVFGYHEVFHSLVVAGSAVHYAAIAIYIVR
jgi:hemolysin III